MRDRALLHKSKLPEFQQWLEDRGWVQRDIKDCWEVLRMYYPGEKGVLLVYEKVDAKEHYTVHGVAHQLAKKFIRDSK